MTCKFWACGHDDIVNTLTVSVRAETADRLALCAFLDLSPIMDLMETVYGDELDGALALDPTIRSLRQMLTAGGHYHLIVGNACATYRTGVDASANFACKHSLSPRRGECFGWSVAIV